MDVSLDARVAISSEVLLQEVSGEAVLLDLKSESYFGLDAVGTRIWRLIERDGNLRSVRASMLEEYDVEPARLDHDLKELIDRLVDAGLLNIQFADAAPT